MEGSLWGVCEVREILRRPGKPEADIALIAELILADKSLMINSTNSKIGAEATDDPMVADCAIDV